MAARRAAHHALMTVHERDAWSTPIVRGVLDRTGLDARDRSFAANLVYETLRWEGTLDWALAKVSSRPLDAMDPAVLDALRLGTWQILRGRVPDSAAVSTTVELVREAVGPRATGFANGVLRALTRRRDHLGWPDRTTDAGLGLELAYPQWIVAQARARFGDRAEAVLTAGNESPGVTLRAVPRGADPNAAGAALVEELVAEGLDASAGSLAPGAVRVPGADPARLAAVAEGRAAVQDESSQVVVAALAAAVSADRGRLAGAQVLDACAGPGGKAVALAERGARVVAAEVHPGRAGAVAAAAGRSAVASRVGVVAADATRGPWTSGWADGVLVDAPCSGLGVVRRRPELRWRRGDDDPDTLGRLQVRLVEAALAAARPGAPVLYSSCTWTAVETVEVVRTVVAASGGAVVVERPAVPPSAGGAVADPDDPGVQLDPAADGTDGMYLALLRRR